MGGSFSITVHVCCARHDHSLYVHDILDAYKTHAVQCCKEVQIQYMTEVTYVFPPTSAAQGNKNSRKFCGNKMLSPHVAAYTVVCGNSGTGKKWPTLARHDIDVDIFADESSIQLECHRRKCFRKRGAPRKLKYKHKHPLRGATTNERTMTPNILVATFRGSSWRKV